jgi:hypothetical protein
LTRYKSHDSSVSNFHRHGLHGDAQGNQVRHISWTVI